jgi:AcrR family transcriptional regulator
MVPAFAQRGAPVTAPSPQSEATTGVRRADAQRNRDKLVAAGREVAAEQGFDASLDEIARRAGVGSGTLYRHFPNRLALLQAVFQDEVNVLVTQAEELLAAPNPFAALETWLRALVVHAGTSRGLAAVLMAVISDPSTDLGARCRAMHAAGARLLQRAQRAGQVRPDVAASDLLKLLNALTLTTEQTPDSGDRLLHVVLDGLRPHEHLGVSP